MTTTIQLAVVGYFSNNLLLAFGCRLLAAQTQQQLLVQLANGLLLPHLIWTFAARVRGETKPYTNAGAHCTWIPIFSQKPPS